VEETSSDAGNTATPNTNAIKRADLMDVVRYAYGCIGPHWRLRSPMDFNPDTMIGEIPSVVARFMLRLFRSNILSRISNVCAIVILCCVSVMLAGISSLYTDVVVDWLRAIHAGYWALIIGCTAVVIAILTEMVASSEWWQSLPHFSYDACLIKEYDDSNGMRPIEWLKKNTERCWIDRMKVSFWGRTFVFASMQVAVREGDHLDETTLYFERFT
jgi:hypothetical protein